MVDDETATRDADASTHGSIDGFTDAELTALALSADPDAPIDHDAVPFVSDDLGPALLPEWYMPATSLRRSTPQAIVLASVAVALFVINVAGVCVTYGIPDPVWK